MKRTTTTILASITLVFLALTCLIFLLTNVAMLAYASPNVITPQFLIERTLFLLTRGAILGMVFGLFMRTKWVWGFLALTILFAVADAIVYATWFLAPLPQELSAAARAGQWVGRSVALLGPFVLYAVLGAYLLLPGTRAEFGGGKRASRSRD